MGLKFTEVQQKIYAMLRDGEPHRRLELLLTYTDEIADPRGLNMHLTQMRKQLRPKGYDIICQFYKRSNHFRIIRLVTPAELKAL